MKDNSKNEVTINIKDCIVTIKSDTEPLDKIVGIADAIADKIAKGITGDSTEERIRRGGIG